MAKENLAQDLSDFLATKNFEVKYTNEQGRDSSPEQAKVFAFDWISPVSGKNYGTAVIVLGEENELQLYFGDNLGKSMSNPEDKDSWFAFMKQIKDFATRHNIGTFTPLDINRLKHTMAGMAAIKEGLFEGYYGTRKTSYMGEATEARLVIRHNRMIGENDKRYRYVESLFIETQDGERFKLPFTKLAGGRAMLEHVRQGGNPYDVRGQHIKAMVQEMNVLARFNRASHSRIFEGQTQQLVEAAREYYAGLQDSLKSMATGRGYQQYFESWTPADIGDGDALVEDIKQLFVEQTIDARIEAAAPILARLQQGAKMKEVAVFENWINRLAEGTWALPDTPESQTKLNNLMKQELIVGPDATNATENLYDVVGDDELFDILSDLARKDPRANIWDDSDVQARLAELGIQTPQSTEAEPADVARDQAPAQQGADKGPLEEVSVDLAKRARDKAEYFVDMDYDDMRDRPYGYSEKQRSKFQKYIDRKEPRAPGDRDWDPPQQGVTEGRMLDESGETLQHILNRFKHEVQQFEQGEDLDTDLYHALYDYYSDAGAMPYGIAKGRTGDPFEWVTDRLDQELGTGNYAPRMAEADPMDTFEMGVMGPAMGGQMVGVGEASGCNMTTEGEYCPEHGLSECGTMEGVDDPINSNSAVTSSFYESELARMKKLALGK